MPYDIQFSKISRNRDRSQMSEFPSQGTGSLTSATAQVVGLAGVEPATSSLSGMRSNQLSYRPPTSPRRPIVRGGYRGFNVVELIGFEPTTP